MSITSYAQECMIDHKMPRRIRKLRLASGLTQKEVSSMVGISNTTLSQYESGRREPSFAVLCSLAQIYEVTTDYILGIEDARAQDVISAEEYDILCRIKLEHGELFSCICDASSKGVDYKQIECVVKALFDYNCSKLTQ